VVQARFEEQRMAVSFGQEWRDDAEAIIPRLGSALEKPCRRAEAQGQPRGRSRVAVKALWAPPNPIVRGLVGGPE
jgi:hypothetical protein